ncbi:polyunsaturated fatty acid lipoxygenase ALOX15B-like [Pholidichthys leucotaenia]
MNMMNYEVTVFTGSQAGAWTFNNIDLTLVNEEGNSAHTVISGWYLLPLFGQCKTTVSCPESLGKLVRLELKKEPWLTLQHSWFPDKIEVLCREESTTYTFPIYEWIVDSRMHCFMEGTARIPNDNSSPSNERYNNWEVEQRRAQYQWDVYEKGIPHCMKADAFQELPYDVRFSLTKTVETGYTAAKALIELKLEQFALSEKKWTSMDDISKLVSVHEPPVTAYVKAHWKEDAFFGYQYLNGTNPIKIQRCAALPENFPVSENEVCLKSGVNLADEIKKGNIFLCDYKSLDGLPSNNIGGRNHFLVAPFVLLHRTSNDELLPIAIQLRQKPGPYNPVFYPSDSEYDWLLAKIFVRSADFNEFELNAHLLRTHLLAEVYTMALMRNLPLVHPLYKLLMPHTRYTIQINYLARTLLISKTGVFTQFASAGAGLMDILRRSLESMTYRSLCIPDDIEDRGMRDVPNYYYRDDGLRLWDIIYRFVQKVLGHYYKTDVLVCGDKELQNWIGDIFEHGFYKREESGIPQKFTTVDEVVKFVTMVIFSCSAQHSAVNTGQFDIGGWMPNSPSSLQLAPPTKKGETNEKWMLDTFPGISTTVQSLAAIWLLSKQSTDDVLLGQYTRDYFTEEFPCQAIKEFQEELDKLSDDIQNRNSKLALAYTYLDPKVVVNSVSI